MRLAPPVLDNAQQGQRAVQKGLLESKKAGRRGRSIKPDPQDFDEVKRDYCRKHHITAAELGARFERDGQLAAELYRLALEAGLTRVRSRQPSIQKYHPDRQGAEEGKPKE